MSIITKQVYWTKLILDTFLEESGLNARVENGDEKARILEGIMITRCAGHSIVKQAEEFGESVDQVKKDIRYLKDLYDATQRTSLILPTRKKSKKELELDREY